MEEKSNQPKITSVAIIFTHWPVKAMAEVSPICISPTGNPESVAIAKAPPSPLKHKPEHKTNSPKQIQKREPETKMWIEIPEMEEEIKQDIVYPWQSKQSEPSIKWDPLSYWDPGAPTSGLAEEFKTNTKMGVSHVKINKYERRVTQ